MRRVDDRAPVAAVEPAREHVGVEGRRRDHGQDLAVARIERDRAAHLVGEEALGLLLQLEVERELEVAAGPAGLAQLLVHELAAAVDHDHAPAVGAAQDRVVGLLDALDAHQVAGAQIGPLLERPRALASPR